MPRENHRGGIGDAVGSADGASSRVKWLVYEDGMELGSALLAGRGLRWRVGWSGGVRCTSANGRLQKEDTPSSASGEGKPPKEPTTPSSAPSGYSALQAAVNDMMRRALEEDQYSALGSVVDTDSSDEEEEDQSEGGIAAIRWNHRPKRGYTSEELNAHKPWVDTSTKKLDRHAIVTAMRKHLRVEGMKSVRNFDGGAFLDDAEDYLERGGGGGSGRSATAMNGKRL